MSERILEHLECPFCLSTVSKPKTFPCPGQHVFCAVCLRLYCERRNVSSGDKLSCPVCRAVVQLGPMRTDGFPDNRVIQNILNELKESQKTTTGTSGSHFNGTLGKCEVHGNSMEFLCKDCNDRLICVRCAVGDHKQHDYNSLADAIKESRRELETLLQDTKQKKAALNQQVKDLKNHLSVIHREVDKEKEIIDYYFTRLSDVVQIRKRELMSILDKHKMDESARVTYRIDALRDIQNSIENYSFNAKEMDDASLLKQKRSLFYGYQQLESKANIINHKDVVSIKFVHDKDATESVISFLRTCGTIKEK